MTNPVVALPDSPPRLGYRAPELAARTGFSERTIRRMIADGVLDTYKVGRSRFVRPESVARVFGGEPSGE
jgi:excisionase family DNA binding protein